jgi:hypothetical protein
VSLRLSVCWTVIFSTALLVACAEVRAPEPVPAPAIDVSGEWEFQEEGGAQRLVLDKNGNGTYAWQDGRILTQSISDGRWKGMWYQEGNDREGGFELLLSDDGREAKGTWWYTRIGTRVIPPGTEGRDFRFSRISSGNSPALP